MNSNHNKQPLLSSIFKIPFVFTLLIWLLIPLSVGYVPAEAQLKKDTKSKTAKVPTAKKKTASDPDTPKSKTDAKAASDDIELPEGMKNFETGIEYSPTPPQKRITFNLEEADLPDLVRLISQITGKRFILSSKIRSIKATVFAPTKVTAGEAYQAFLSILELNGMSVVRAGRYYKIVESGGIENRPIELQTEENENIPQGDRYITRIHTLDHLSADDAASLLGRFKSGDGSITSYVPTNTLIISDTGTNIRRMMRIIKIIDVPHTSEHVWIEPVHYAEATELAQRLTEIFDVSTTPKKGASKPKPAPAKNVKKSSTPTSIGTSSGEARITKILADERTNSLIILATEHAYLRILEMLRHLDVPMEGEGHIRVHYLQYSDAEEIAATLSKLVGRGAPKGGKGAKDAVAIFEGNIAITAHKTSNALVITSSAHDYAALRRTIDQLDVERRQVFIEAVIMELNVKRSANLGVSYHGGIPDVPTDDSLFVTGFQAQNTILGLQGAMANPDLLTGLAVGVQGPQIDVPGLEMSIPGFGVLLNAVAGSSDANILSTPNLIAMDNVEAEISIGSNEALQTSALSSYNLGGLGSMLGGQASQAAGLLSGLSGFGGFGGSVPRQDVGTTIKITPHINESDEIRLEISEEISSVGAPEAGNVGVKPVNRTRAKTEVSVQDQQTVVIGGLMRDAVSSGKDKVPILGDIPLIGVLFRSSKKDKVKKNLILFLTPYIIRSPDDLRAIYERKMRERQEFLDRYFVATGSDYQAPVDYSRTRGLVGEMLKELNELDDKKKLYEETNTHPSTNHEPKNAIGLAITQEENSSSDEEEESSSESETPQPTPNPYPFNLPPQFQNNPPIPPASPTPYPQPSGD